MKGCSELVSASKKTRFDELIKEVKSCDACNLCIKANNRVIGEGSLDSRVIFVGEAPGRMEDEVGRPFVGSAGKLLDYLLLRANLSRDEIFITNVVMCRPPRNRKPLKKEVKACSGHLNKLLEIIEPRVIAPMGNSAIEHIFDKFDLEKTIIRDLHGKVCETRAFWGGVTVYPLYHPAAAIYNRKLLRELEKDVSGLATLLN